MQTKKIRSFTDLIAWKEGHALVLDVYLAINKFPEKEKFGLYSQISRSAVSITSNIAEGFSRSSKKEKIQFYRMSLGSLTELQNQILIARDVGYFSQRIFKNVADRTVIVAKLIQGLIKSSKSY
jgi:four helix bundle protein